MLHLLPEPFRLLTAMLRLLTAMFRLLTAMFRLLTAMLRLLTAMLRLLGGKGGGGPPPSGSISLFTYCTPYYLIGVLFPGFVKRWAKSSATILAPGRLSRACIFTLR